MGVAAEYFLLLAGELMFLVPIGLGLIYLKITKQNGENPLAIKPVPSGLLVLSVLCIMGAQYFITYITLPIQAILIFIFGAETATSQMAVPSGFWEFIAAFITLCVVAPIVEELLCRGILIRLFEKYGATIAVFASSFAAITTLYTSSFVFVAKSVLIPKNLVNLLVPNCSKALLNSG